MTPGAGSERVKPRSPVLVLQTSTQFEVWLRSSGGSRRAVGRVGIGLVRDAQRHGQDLLDELIGTALRRFEREKRLAIGVKRKLRRR